MTDGVRARRVRAFLGFVLGVAAATAFGATDIPLDGNRMQLVDTGHPGGRRNLVGLTDAGVTLTTIDPTVTGATAYIGRVGVGAVTTLDLPASGWSHTGDPSRRDYKFKSHTNGVVSARLVDGRSLRFSSHGPAAYPLDGVQQGAVGVIVEVGDVRFCSLFGGTIARDDGAMFRARRAPAPQGCPSLGTPPTTTTTTTTTTTIETTTSTTLVGVDCPSAPDSGTNDLPDGCPCVGNNDCCGVCGGSEQNPICGGNVKPNAPPRVFRHRLQPAGLRHQ